MRSLTEAFIPFPKPYLVEKKALKIYYQGIRFCYIGPSNYHIIIMSKKLLQPKLGFGRWLYAGLLFFGLSFLNTGTLSAQCPTGAVCDTFDLGDIASDYDFNAPADFPAACYDSLVLSIPAGNWIDSVSTSYDMTAASGAWMSEQRSWLYSPTTAQGEPAAAAGTGLGGTMSYSRTGLTFANYATGNVTIHMHAGRTWGGSGCDPTYNKVDDDTWVVIAYYSPVPSCLPPLGAQNNSVTATAGTFSWNAASGAVGYEYEVRTSGAAGSGATGLVASGSVTGTSATATGLSPNTAYTFYVRTDCGSSSYSNWVGSVSFQTSCSVYTAPFNENFDDATLWVGRNTIDPCWNATPSAGSTWSWEPRNSGPTSGNGPLGDLTGGNFMYCEASIGGSFPDAEFVSPLIDVSGLTVPALYFHQHRNANGGTIADMKVEVSNDFGATWTNVYTITGETQSGSSAPWSLEFINLGGYTGDTIQVKFSQTFLGCCGDAAIDSVVVDEAPACPWPGNLSVVSTSSSDATLSWLDPTNSSWDIEYGAPGFTQGNGTQVTVSSNPGTITGLASGTSYDAYIRSNCTASGNGTSIWVGPITFTTLCNIFTAPFLENFDDTLWTASGNNANNTLDPCWIASPDVTNGSEPFKWIPRASAPTSGNGPTVDVTGGNFLYVEASGSSSGDSAWIQTPAIDVSGLTTPSLWFEQHRFSNGATIADMKVLVSNDLGATWTQEYLVTGDVQTSINDPYELVLVTLPNYAGDTIIVRFQQDGNGCCGDAAIDKVEIKEAPTCPWPTSQELLSVTDSNATIFWTDNVSSSWDIEWGPVGFTQGTGSVTQVFNDTVTFGPLGANTCYDVYIRANCSAGGNGTSIWRGPITFCTACAPFTAPYTQNYDGTTAPELDNCWSPIAFNPSFTNYELQTDAFRNFSPPNSMEIHNASSTSGFIGIASPRFSDLDTNKRIEFQVYDEDGSFTGSDLIVGVMTDLSDETTFEAVDTIFEVDMPNDVWDFVIVDLVDHSISSGGGYVVFKHGMNSTFDNLHIDDFSYDEIPSCQPPLINTLGVTGVSTTQATALWDTNSQGIKHYYAWGAVGFTPAGAGQLGIDSVAGTINQGTLTGLAPQTTYEFYVQDSCSATGLSPWVGPFQFTTPCLPSTMPYYESFDTWALACWDSVGGNSFWQPYNSGTGDNYARADFWVNSTGTYHLTSRPVAITSDAQLRFYWSHLYNSFYDDRFVVMTKTLSATTWDTVLDLFGPAFNDPTAGSFNSPGSFIEEEIILDPNYTGDTIQVKLVGLSDWGPDLFINDLYIEPAPTCPKLSNLDASNIGPFSADLTWNSSPNANYYQVWYGPSGFYQGTQTTQGTQDTTSNPLYAASGLSGNTCYDFLVRSVCAPGDTAEWVGPFTFCTPCAPFTAPYSEDFDALGTALAGNLGNCWNTNPPTTTGFTFRTNSGTTTSGSTGPNGDATTGSGIYLYTEASSGSAGDETELISPLVDISASSNPQVKFAYHMYGATIDSLNVEINDGTGWNSLMYIQGGQQTSNSDPWRDTAVSISAYTGDIQVRFRVTRGSSFTGDVSIDDVEIGDPILDDAQIDAILVDGGCGDSNTAVSVVFTNLGLNTISSMPVSINVSGTQSLNINGAYTGSLATDQTDTVLVGTVNTYTGDLLSFDAVLQLANDQVSFNDSASVDSINWNPYEPIGYDTTACASDDSVSLRAMSLSGIQYGWFATNNTMTDTIPLVVGDTATFAAGTAQTTYYLGYLTSLDSLSTTFAGGNGQAGNAFDVMPNGSLSISAMDIHIGGTGTEDVSIYYRLGTATGNVGAGAVASGAWTLHESFTGVTGAGVGNPTYLQFTNPLALPGGTVSAIMVVLTSSANIDYTNGNTVGGVFAQNNDITIYEGYGISWSGTDIGGSFSPRNWNGRLYYGSAGCSDIRTPVNITLGTDTTEAAFTETNTAPFVYDFDASTSVNADTYDWDFGDGNTGTGMNVTHTYAANGSYTVILTTTDTTGCSSTDTATVMLNLNVGLEDNPLANSLSVYPNPTSNQFNITFREVGSADVNVVLRDAQGREVMNLSERFSGGEFSRDINVAHLAKGVYMLEINSGEYSAHRRVSIR